MPTGQLQPATCWPLVIVNNSVYSEPGHSGASGSQAGLALQEPANQQHLSLSCFCCFPSHLYELITSDSETAQLACEMVLHEQRNGSTHRAEASHSSQCSDNRKIALALPPCPSVSAHDFALLYVPWSRTEMLKNHRIVSMDKHL